MDRRRQISVILFFLYLAAVGYICFSSGDNFPSFDDSIFGVATDKVVHFTMFLPFVFLFYIACRPGNAGRPLAFWTVSIVAGFLLATVTESVQMLLPSRTAELFDCVADGLGVMGGAAFTLLLIINKKI